MSENIQTVTHEYGATRLGVIVEMSGEYQMVRELHNHAPHILMGSARDLTAKIGQTGTLTFTEGGPTGGFWKFVADKK